MEEARKERLEASELITIHVDEIGTQKLVLEDVHATIDDALKLLLIQLCPSSGTRRNTVTAFVGLSAYPGRITATIALAL